MLLKFADSEVETSWASRLRRKRVQPLLDMIGVGKPTRILDVGGTEQFWANLWNEGFPPGVSITVLNLAPTVTSGRYPIEAVVGDARDLSRFRPDKFDICFSNSVIEHVGNLGDQMQMAREIHSVAPRYFVQTPYRNFPLEPHFHVPGWAMLPVSLRTELHRNFYLGWVKAEPDYLRAKSDIEQIRLLNVREFTALFADGKIVRERIGPLLKSLIAIR